MTQTPSEFEAPTGSSSTPPTRVVVVGGCSASALAREVLQRKLGHLVQLAQDSAQADQRAGAPGAAGNNRASEMFNIVSQNDLDDLSLSLCATADNKPDRPAWVSPYGPSRSQTAHGRAKSSTKRTPRGG